MVWAGMPYSHFFLTTAVPVCRNGSLCSLMRHTHRAENITHMHLPCPDLLAGWEGGGTKWKGKEREKEREKGRERGGGKG